MLLSSSFTFRAQFVAKVIALDLYYCRQPSTPIPSTLFPTALTVQTKKDMTHFPRLSLRVRLIYLPHLNSWLRGLVVATPAAVITLLLLLRSNYRQHDTKRVEGCHGLLRMRHPQSLNGSDRVGRSCLSCLSCLYQKPLALRNLLCPCVDGIIG